MRQLRLSNFRSYAAASVELAPGTNIFHGDNGEGKTNLLEAVYVTALGRSPRVGRELELVRHGHDRAEAQLQVEHQQRGPAELRWRLGLDSGAAQRRLQINGKSARSVDAAGWMRVVLFSPDDLELVKGSGEARRRLLNVALAQSEPGYAAHLARAQKALSQRNGLLKQIRDGAQPAAALAEWDTVLATESGWVMSRRAALARQLAARAPELYAQMAGAEEQLEVRYLPGLEAGTGSRGLDSTEAGELTAAVLRALSQRVGEEISRGVTLSGFHRDDLALGLSQRPARAYASQGQQRSIVITLKAAERAIQWEAAGEPPVMLLDDVFSELDPDRQEGLVHLLAGGGQALLTTAQSAEAGRFTAPGVRRFRVSGAGSADGSSLGQEA